MGEDREGTRAETSTSERLRGCLYWNGRSYELACVDDLCHGSSRTLCGLEEGYDFGVEDDFDDDYGDWDDE